MMQRTQGESRFAVLAEFETALGDPHDPASIVSFESAAALDDAAEFPSAAIALIDEFGLQRYYVPTEYGGLLDDVTVPMLMIRALARRDLAVAVAHGKTFLGTICAWVGGDAQLQQRVADIAVTGDPVSWGLTERGHGSDLAASETVLIIDDTLPTDDKSIRLTGHKWPINNATRGRAITVLARLEGQTGPRAHSLVFVDKNKVDEASISYLAKTSTHGIRAADISGIEFAGTVLDDESVIGQPGHGLEIVLKSLQLTRPLCTALSLGAADLALDLAWEHCAGRVLYGRPMAELPGARATLVAATADALMTEAVALTGARQLHHRPEEMALVSAFVKFAVPDVVDGLFRDLGLFLGAASQLVGQYPGNVFAKAARDHRVVAIFDGNSVVNLSVVINEFPSMLRDRPMPAGDAFDDVFALADAPPPIDYAAFRLFTRQGSTVLRALPSLVERIDELGDAGLASVARALEAEYVACLAELREAPRAPFAPPQSFVLAERISLLYAAAASMAFFFANVRAVDTDGVDAALWRDRLWLRLALGRLAERIGIEGEWLNAELVDEAFAVVTAIRENGTRVSLIEGLIR